MIHRDPLWNTDRFVSWDKETHLIQPGLLVPPMVCASTYDGKSPPQLLWPKQTALHLFAALLDSDQIICGANIAFDMAVAASEQPELIPLIIAKYERGEVFDVLIAQALDAIAGGHLFVDPRDGGPLRDPVTGKTKRRYSLAICMDLQLGRKDAKVNDVYRLRYAEFEWVQPEYWPHEARQYPIDDAVNTRDLAVDQAGKLRNLHNMTAQVRAALALHFGACWGLRTDGLTVHRLQQETTEKRAAAVERFRSHGWFHADERVNKPAVKLAAAIAYGADAVSKCPHCGGSGCGISAKSGNEIQCKACDATGLDLNTAPQLPRTDSGRVSTSRDTLKESGDDDLEAFGSISEMDKTLGTFLPFVTEGVTRPLDLRPNVLVASGRVSYEESPIHQLPRGGEIRAAFRARQGYVYCSVDYGTGELVTLSQVNVELHKAGVIPDYPAMALALQAGQDLHTRLAARIDGGREYAAMLAMVEAGQKQAKNLRQVAKPVNFGLPGGMGTAKLVFTARKDGVRFCVLAGALTKCGSAGKVTEWRERPCTPTCVVCLELGDGYRGLWSDEFYEMPHFFKWVKSITEDGDGEMPQLGSGRIRGGCAFTDGANTMFQGLLADITKQAYWVATAESLTDRGSPLWGAYFPVDMHDELIAEIPEGQAHEGGHRLAQIMREAAREYCPDVPMKAEPALARRWFKGMEKVEIGGRLRPWWPQKWVPVDQAEAAQMEADRAS